MQRIKEIIRKQVKANGLEFEQDISTEILPLMGAVVLSEDNSVCNPTLSAKLSYIDGREAFRSDLTLYTEDDWVYVEMTYMERVFIKRFLRVKLKMENVKKASEMAIKIQNDFNNFKEILL